LDRFLAELLLSGYRWVKESYSDLTVYIRVQISEMCSSQGRGEFLLFLPRLTSA
jgi:hypothetical protein